MPPENEKVIQDIVGSIRKLVRAVYQDSSKISKYFGLTGPQSSVLRVLITQGPISSAELSRILYVTPSNITGIIDRLEKKGLVTRVRKNGDRRVSLIMLTEKGTGLGRALPDPIEKKFISQLSYLDPQQIRQLAEAMNQILHLFDAEQIQEEPFDLS